MSGEPPFKMMKFDEAFVWMGKDGQGKFRYSCQYCTAFPEIVKRSGECSRKKLPGLCKPEGIYSTGAQLSAHLKLSYHAESKKAFDLRALRPQERLQKSQIGIIFSTQNRQLAVTVGSHILDIYCDAKHLTLSAHSWPARKIAQQMGLALDLEKNFVPHTPKSGDLLYVNPVQHKMFLDYIVTADLDRLKAQLADAVAISIRVDGSVDKYQVGNTFVMAKVVDSVGLDHLVFIGFEEPKERKAKGKLFC